MSKLLWRVLSEVSVWDGIRGHVVEVRQNAPSCGCPCHIARVILDDGYKADPYYLEAVIYELTSHIEEFHREGA